MNFYELKRKMQDYEHLVKTTDHLKQMVDAVQAAFQEKVSDLPKLTPVNLYGVTIQVEDATALNLMQIHYSRLAAQQQEMEKEMGIEPCTPPSLE